MVLARVAVPGESGNAALQASVATPVPLVLGLERERRSMVLMQVQARGAPGLAEMLAPPKALRDLRKVQAWHVR